MQIGRTRFLSTHRIVSLVTLTILCFTFTASPSNADPGPTPLARAIVTSAPTKSVRQAIDTAVFEPRQTSTTQKQRTTAPHAVQGQMHPAARAAITAGGAFGGMIVGGRVGAFLEGDRCNCDDPGLKGAFIGMPIGAVLAGIAAWKMTK